MTAMMIGVLLLEYDLVYMLASDLAEEPRLGRPAPNEQGTLNALLPAGFFVHQDALVKNAQALAQAAADKHDKRLGEAFGQVAQTCVGCHSTYLHEELNFDHEEPGPPLLP
jgi:mono/diheme cytochrome c family protein